MTAASGSLVNIDDVVIIGMGTAVSASVHLSNGDSPAVGANVVFETTIDSMTWSVASSFLSSGSAEGEVTSVSAPGDYQVLVGAAMFLRVRLTAIISGSLNVIALAKDGATIMRVVNTNPNSLLVTPISANPADLLAQVSSPNPAAFLVKAYLQVLDSTGNFPFDPDSCSRVYTYGGPGGVRDSDTCSDGIHVWKKNYTFTGSNLTGETMWVKQ